MQRPDYSLSRFLQDRQRWTDSCGKKHHGSSNSGSSPTTTWYSSSNGVASGADTKRRRKTPPTTPTPEGLCRLVTKPAVLVFNKLNITRHCMFIFDIASIPISTFIVALLKDFSMKRYCSMSGGQSNHKMGHK